MDRAALKWCSGPLEVTGGLQAPDWGTSLFYRPTDYFFPLSPLAWQRDEPLGSEALDASCFLFDFLSVEGAARWLSGDRTEGVIRLVDKGIGIGVSPSLAILSGRNGAGLELSGTFPEFQVRFEGVDWFYANGSSQWEGIGGLSTVKGQVTYNLEFYRDGTGTVLGNSSTGPSATTYLFASVEGPFPAKWWTYLSLLKSVDGGPLLAWTRIRWSLGGPFTLSLQAWLPLGASG